MRSILAWAASAALAGAVLLTAPLPVTATSCGGPSQAITGVPASLNWGSAMQGTEKRVRISTLISWCSNSTYVPYFGFSYWCNNAVYGGATNCAVDTADTLTRARMKMAIRVEETCSIATNTCWSACSGVNAIFTAGSGASAFRQLTPSTLGTGITAVFDMNFASNCSGSAGADTLRFKDFYLGVTIPATTNSGTYSSAFTVGIR